MSPHKGLLCLFSHPLPYSVSFFLFLSRNNAVRVSIAAVPVLMNYRRAFYGFRNSHLEPWINQQPSLSQPSPQENEGREVHFTWTTAPLLFLLSHMGPWAHGTLLQNFLFWLLTKGPEVKAEISMQLPVFSRGKGFFITLAWLTKADWWECTGTL